MTISNQERGKGEKNRQLRNSRDAILPEFLNGVLDIAEGSSRFNSLISVPHPFLLFLVPSRPPFPLSRFQNLLPGILALLLTSLSPSANADGGTVLAEQVSGPYRVTLFGDPTPLRAGPADLSVLVQDAQTRAPLLGQRIQIAVTASAVTDPNSEAWVPPCCSMKKSVTTAEATHAAAQNKLLSAANLILPASGPHRITVRILPPATAGAAASAQATALATLTADVEIAPPAPPATAYWPYLALPPFLIGGFVLHQRLRRRDNHSAGPRLPDF